MDDPEELARLNAELDAEILRAEESGVGVSMRLDDGDVRSALARPVVRYDEEEVVVLPELPPLRAMRPDEIDQVAGVRGLDPRAIRVAALDFKRVAAAEWPRWNVGGRWLRPCKVHFLKCGNDRPECEPREVFPSWCMTDDARRVAEFRRLDGAVFPREKHEGIKAWSTAGKSWPVGAADLLPGHCAERYGCVLLTEGGPDSLAAFHFLLQHEMLGRVLPVTMLGASNKMAGDALGLFAGRRVRIVVQADEVHEMRRTLAGGRESVRRTRAGFDAALRWQEQLAGAGAAVSCFSLEGLTRADGAAVKDLNDLALCSPEVLRDPEVREAFTWWDF